MSRISRVLLVLALVHSGLLPAQQPAGPRTRVYKVEQRTMLNEVPADAAKVRWWISIPGNERHQEILDIVVKKAPGKWSYTHDQERGNGFLFVEVDKPGVDSLEVVIEFTLRRDPVLMTLDPDRAGVITDSHRQMFYEELRPDSPHMNVDADIRRIAKEVCGNETSVVRQAHMLLDHVAAFADHYSKDPTKPNCGVGDAKVCLEKAGGCCTDLHSLFIALVRARGIPARLQMGYRLLDKNLGKADVDPGYRCWPEYFVPGYGWVPCDIVEADSSEGAVRAMWTNGLSEQRLWLNEGRDFILSPRQASGPVNTMVMGHAEIDGKVARVLPDGDKKPQLSRRIRFDEVKDSNAATMGVAVGK